MIRLFATDLDDTLLNADKQIDQHNLDALQKLQQAGVQVTVASGRNEVEIENVVQDIPGDFHRICQNGAFIYLHSNEQIFGSSFEPELAKQIYQVGQEAGIYCFIATSKTMYITDKNQYIKRKAKQISVNLVYEPNIVEKIGEQFSPSKFCFLGEEAPLLQLKQLFLDTFPNQIDTFLSSPYCLDVMPHGINKGNGIRHLAKQLDLELTNVACIGDSENDIPMFRTVPHSFAMSGAKPSVRKEAKHIVSSVAEAANWVLAYNENLTLQK